MMGDMQMVGMRKVGIVRSFLVFAGRMVLCRFSVILRGMLVVLMDFVFVHGSLSGFIGKGRSIAAFDEPFSTPLCQIGAAPCYAARPAHVPSCATSCRISCTTLSQLPNADCR